MSFYKEIIEKINTNLPDAEFELQDTAGDDNHFKLRIKSDVFQDKTKLQNHSFMNKILNDLYKKGLHALEIEILNN